MYFYNIQRLVIIHRGPSSMTSIYGHYLVISTSHFTSWVQSKHPRMAHKASSRYPDADHLVTEYGSINQLLISESPWRSSTENKACFPIRDGKADLIR